MKREKPQHVKPSRAKKEYPLAANDELSAKKLEVEFIGSRSEIERELKSIRDDMIKTMQGLLKSGREFSQEFVDEHFFGMRIPQGGGPAAIHATPAGVQIWQEKFKRKHIDEAAPPPKEGEKSAKALSNEYQGWNQTILKELNQLRTRLIGDVQKSTKMSLKEAERNVDHFLIGLRKPSSSTETLYATEEGQRLWREKYPRERRKDSPPSPGKS